jgi:branched-chain amino acid transport system substrate-binding protein
MRMWNHSRLAIGLTIVLAATAAGCGAPALQIQEPVKIGVLAPLNSGVAAAARATVQGATLAIDELNGSRGAGAPITLVVQDDRGNVEEAARQFEGLVAQRVAAIVGPLTDATAIAVAPLAERAGVALVSPGATGTIPYAGSSFFRTALPAESQARALAEFAIQTKRARRVSIIQDGNEYGTLVALAFSQRVRAMRGEIVGTRLYKDGQTDFSRHANGVVADGADAVLIAGYPDEGALILAALKNRGARLTVLGSDALYSTDLLTWARGATDDLYLPAPFVASEPLPAVQDFVARYRRKFNETPDHFAAQGYDAVKMIVSAIRQSGSTPAAVRAALQGMRRFPGVTGEISLDRWGAPTRPVGIARVRIGQFELVRR